MKVIFLHGDNSPKLRDRLTLFIKYGKDKGFEVVRVDREEKGDLSEIIRAESLFEKKRLIIIDDFARLDSKLVDFLNKFKLLEETIVFFKEGGTFPKKLTDSLKVEVKLEEFKLPREIFKFLDSLFPGNYETAFTLFHRVIEKEPVEFVFALLVRHVRDLYLIGVDQELLGYPSWRLAKLTSQAKRHGKKKLKRLINDLAKIDLAVKTSSIDLTQSLDFLLAKYLE